MKSIEQLHNEIQLLKDNNIDTYELVRIADAIEHEVEEGYIELPKDADGEHIHIGDRVEDNERVARIVLTDGSWEPSVYIEKIPGVLHEHFCNEISHYHEPTVEDVLEEFASERIKLLLGRPMAVSDEDLDEYCEDNRKACEKLIAEYAQKLQIREAE